MNINTHMAPISSSLGFRKEIRKEDDLGISYSKKDMSFTSIIGFRYDNLPDISFSCFFSNHMSPKIKRYISGESV
jgi:hypothetical protein